MKSSVFSAEFLPLSWAPGAVDVATGAVVMWVDFDWGNAGELNFGRGNFVRRIACATLRGCCATPASDAAPESAKVRMHFPLRARRNQKRSGSSQTQTPASGV